jgi:Ca2+-binding EF-hand superfamily protein
VTSGGHFDFVKFLVAAEMGKGGVGNHPHLTEEELKEFQELFDLVDLDHGGSISPEELGSLMETLGLKPSQVSRRHFLALRGYA